MKNLLNLIIKTAFIFIVLFLLIPVFGESTWTQTMITGLVLSLLAYIVGDMWVLPKFGNLLSVVVDFVIAGAVIWAMMKLLPQFVLSTSGVWIIALVLALGEWLFHLYLESTQAFGKKAGT